MEVLFDDWGSDQDRSNASTTGLISTNCPQSDDADYNDTDFDTESCTGFYLHNITATDSSGKKHKLSIKYLYRK